MLPDVVHGLLLLLMLGTILRITEYLLSQRAPDSRFYKYLVFAY